MHNIVPEQPDSILGFITGPSVTFPFMWSVLNLFKNDPENRFNMDWLLVHGPYIHANRNQLQEQFMDTGREWLLSVDNDITFTPGDVFALYEEADKCGPGVYHGSYILENGFQVCGVWNDDEPYVYHNLVRLPEEPAEIGVVGLGFTLIHREVFEATGPEAFWPVNGFSTGEDLSFSWRAREAGYIPILVPKCDVGHQKTNTLYTSGSMRNSIGDEMNLVQLDEELKELNRKLMEEVKT
jgi:hypothetical protein